MQLSEKPKACSQFVIDFLESTLNFEHFEKNMSLIAQKYFWSYWLRKTCLLKCIKGLVSENPLAVNVLTSPKNCWNLQKSTFNLLSHHFEPAWVRKSHFQWDPGFQNCLLTTPKNCWKLQKSTSTKHSHHFGPAWVRKGHFQLHPRFKDCLLTRWLPTTGILVVIGIVTATNSNAFIWKTKTLFPICYCSFGMYIKFWTFWKKMWDS